MTDSVNWVAFFEPRGFIVPRLYCPENGGPNVKSTLVFALFLAQAATGGWIDLFDGKTMKGWSPVGSAVWEVKDGSLSANPSAQPQVAAADGKAVTASGFLQSDRAFGDFDLTAEFRGEPNTNSGIFIRCSAGQTISQNSCYEVNISDNHATHPTGSIVGMHTTLPNRITTAGKWSSMEISARGPHIVVKVDGKTVLDVQDPKFTTGAIALQAGGPNGPGPIQFRQVRIRS
jgi:hypothetical protein